MSRVDSANGENLRCFKELADSSASKKYVAQERPAAFGINDANHTSSGPPNASESSPHITLDCTTAAHEGLKSYAAAYVQEVVKTGLKSAIMSLVCPVVKQEGSSRTSDDESSEYSQIEALVAAALRDYDAPAIANHDRQQRHVREAVEQDQVSVNSSVYANTNIAKDPSEYLGISRAVLFIQKLVVDRESSKKEAADISIQHTRTLKKLDSTTTELDRATAQLSKNQDNYDSTIEHLTDQMKELEKQNDLIKEQLNQTQAKKDEVSKELSKVREEKQQDLRQKDLVDKKLQSTEEKLNKTNKEKNSANEQLTKIKDDCEMLQGNSREINIRLNKTETKLSEAQSMLSDTKKKLINTEQKVLDKGEEYLQTRTKLLDTKTRLWWVQTGLVMVVVFAAALTLHRNISDTLHRNISDTLHQTTIGAWHQNVSGVHQRHPAIYVDWHDSMISAAATDPLSGRSLEIKQWTTVTTDGDDFGDREIASIQPELSFEWMHEHLASETLHRCCSFENYYAGARIHQDEHGTLNVELPDNNVTVREFAADWILQVFKNMAGKLAERYSTVPVKLIFVVPFADEHSRSMLPKLFRTVLSVLSSLQLPFQRLETAFVYETTAVASWVFREDHVAAAAAQDLKQMMGEQVGYMMQSTTAQHVVIFDVQRSRTIAYQITFKNGSSFISNQNTLQIGQVDFEIATAHLVQEKLHNRNIDPNLVRGNIRFSAAYCMKKLGSRIDALSTAMCRLSQVGKTQINPSILVNWLEYKTASSEIFNKIMQLFTTVVREAARETDDGRISVYASRGVYAIPGLVQKVEHVVQNIEAVSNDVIKFDRKDVMEGATHLNQESYFQPREEGMKVFYPIADRVASKENAEAISVGVQNLIETCQRLDEVTGPFLEEAFGDFGDRLDHVLETASSTHKNKVEELRKSIGTLIKKHDMASNRFLGHKGGQKIARFLCEKAFA